jgi:predicted kinase
MLFVECRAPAQVLAERALAREHRERHGSDATLSVVLQEQANWEPLDEVSGDAHVIIRSDRPLSRIVAELVGLLDARLSAQHC